MVDKTLIRVLSALATAAAPGQGCYVRRLLLLALQSRSARVSAVSGAFALKRDAARPHSWTPRVGGCILVQHDGYTQIYGPRVFKVRPKTLQPWWVAGREVAGRSGRRHPVRGRPQCAICFPAPPYQCMAFQKSVSSSSGHMCLCVASVLLIRTTSSAAAPQHPDISSALVAVYTDAALAKINFRWRTALIVRPSASARPC